MKGRSLSLILLLVLAQFIVFPLSVWAAGNVVGASSTAWGVSNQQGKEVFYDQGRFWVFYTNGTEWGWRSSTDNSTWSGFTTIRASTWAVTFDLAHNSTDHRIHWVNADGTANDNAYYRSGVLQGDGSINWDAAESIVFTPFDVTFGWNIPRIILGDDGTIFIAAMQYPGRSVHVSHSTSKYGAWVAASGYPKTLSVGVPDVDEFIDMVAVGLNDAGGPKVWLSVNQEGYRTYGYRYAGVGSTWGTAVDISGNTTNLRGACMCTNGSDVYLFTSDDSENDLRYNLFNHTTETWSDDVIIRDLAEPVSPACMYNPTGQNVWVIHARSDTFYYDILEISSNTFTEQDTLFTDSDIEGLGKYSIYPYPYNGYLGVAYSQGTEDPWNVKFYAYDFTPRNSFGAFVEDADFDPIVFVDKWYRFRAWAYLSQDIAAGSVDTIRLRFFEGAGNEIGVEYRNTTEAFRIYSDSAYVDLSSASSATTANSSGWNNVTATFILKVSSLALDAVDVDLQLWVNTTAGTTYDWQTVNSSLFDLYNLGGFTQSSINGNCSKIQGGDTFEMYCEENSSIEVNQTFYHLEHYHAQFAIQLGFGGTGEDELWQDFYGGPLEIHTDPQDWILYIYWQYFDPINKTTVTGWTVRLFMEEGDQGADDHWTSINATWYNAAGVAERTDTITAFIEEEPRAQIRLWVDLWFNQANASTVHGGRVNSYYYGMRKAVSFLWAGDWAPYLSNSTESMYFGANTDAVGNVTSSMNLELVTVGYNLTRGSQPGGVDPFRATIKNFDISEFRLSPISQVRGVNTPIRVDTLVPDMPASGFFAPLYTAIVSLANWIWSALAYVMQVAWDALATQFPWFTGFWETMGSAIADLASLFGTIWGYLVGFFSFLISGIGYVTAPLAIIGQAWTYILESLSIITGIASPDLITIFIIVIFAVPIVGSVYQGDFGYPLTLARQTWGVVNAISTWSYNFITWVVGTILGLIRG